MRSSCSHEHIGDCPIFVYSLVSDCTNILTSHNIYKWQADKRRQAARPRSASFAGSTRSTDPAFQHIHEPGGFRRNYLLMRRGEDGPSELPHHIPRNFIEFLYLFGHFVSSMLLSPSIELLLIPNRPAKISRKSKRRMTTSGATWRLRLDGHLPQRAISQERHPFRSASRLRRARTCTRRASGRRYFLDPGHEGRGRTA